MPAEQWKPAQLVIELDVFLPTALIVAVLALWSELSFVRIVGLVAGDAGCRDFHTVQIAGMAPGAFGCAVCAVERELRRFVVVERHR